MFVVVYFYFVVVSVFCSCIFLFCSCICICSRICICSSICICMFKIKWGWERPRKAILERNTDYRLTCSIIEGATFTLVEIVNKSNLFYLLAHHLLGGILIGPQFSNFCPNLIVFGCIVELAMLHSVK